MSRLTLELNVSAPDFERVDIFKRSISLAEFRGKKVFLGFFRHAGCPFCNLRVHALQKQHQAMRDLGMEMIFFFESPARLLRNSTFHKEVNPIPIVSDPEKEIYATYGIEHSPAKSVQGHLTHFIQSAIKAKINKLPIYPMKEGESFHTIPAEFLIDEEGIIRHIHYSKGLADRTAMDHIFAFAKNQPVVA